VGEGLAHTTRLYGSPTIPVNEVEVCWRLSSTAFTAIKDRQRGIFAIFLSGDWPVQEEYYSFYYGQLAHEIAHLLNAELYDCYVEGLNTVFAEVLCTRQSVDWRCWRNHYSNNPGSFYATTYRMMKEVSDAAGAEHMRHILRCAVSTDASQERLHLCIDQWLDSLPRDKKVAVKAKIREHAPCVNRAREDDHMQEYVFRLPRNES